jgi:hypothetical protein
MNRSNPGVTMERPALLRRLEELLDEAQQLGYWGTIAIGIKNGVPELLRKSVTEQLRTPEERPRGRHTYR